MSQTYDCVVTQITWERVQLTLRVNLTAHDTPDDVAGPGSTGSADAPGEGAGDGARDGGADRNEVDPNTDLVDEETAGGLADPDAGDDDAADGEPLDPDELAAVEPEIPDDVDDHTLSFVIREGKRRYPVDFREVAEGVYDLTINITRFNGRKQIPNGTWRVQAMIGSVRGPVATFDVPQLDQLDDASRVFLYDGNKTAMTISFGISEDEVRPEFLMRTYQLFGRSASSTKSRKFAPARTLRQRVTSYRTRSKLVGRLYRLARRFARGNGNRVLFVSDQRANIEGNLLRVRDRMVERGLDRQLDLRYSFRLPSTGSKLGTLRTIYLIATSDIVLLDDYFTLFTNLKVAPQTRVIQLWHAGSGFKSVGFSRFGKYGSPKLQNPHRQYTYAIAGSRHLVPFYAEAFGIEESAVIPTGLPRIDTFLDDQHSGRSAEKVYRRYPALRDKRVVLFAPTFRGRGIRDAHYDYSQIDFAALADACGEDTVVLFRMHHFVHEPVPIPEQYRDRFFDFGDYPDSNELLHAVDLLITDYSSIIYEFSLLDRPMLFFAPDKLNYSATRGFHRDFDTTAPGRVCGTFQELVDAIRAGDFETWKIAKFREENFDYVDTHSADRVIDWLILGDPRELAGRLAIDDADPPTAPVVVGQGGAS